MTSYNSSELLARESNETIKKIIDIWNTDNAVYVKQIINPLVLKILTYENIDINIKYEGNDILTIIKIRSDLVKILHTIDNFLDIFYQSDYCFPSALLTHLREIYMTIKQTPAPSNISSEMIMMSIFFLRLLCPIITNNEIVKNDMTNDMSKILIFVTKILIKISSCETFKDKQICGSNFKRICNSMISKQTINMQNFADKLLIGKSLIDHNTCITNKFLASDLITWSSLLLNGTIQDNDIIKQYESLVSKLLDIENVDWNVINENDTYISCQSEWGGVGVIKAEGLVNSDYKQVYEYILQNANSREVDPLVCSCNDIQIYSGNLKMIRSVWKLRFPLQKRECIFLQYNEIVDYPDKIGIVCWITIENNIPIEKNIIRAEGLKGYIIKPHDETTSSVKLLAHYDAKGNLDKLPSKFLMKSSMDSQGKNIKRIQRKFITTL